MNKTNWINTYSDKRQTRKYQVGGPMAPEAGMAPPPEAGGGPDLEGMLMEYAQTRDPQLAVAICDMLIEMMAAQQGGAAAPAPEGEMMAAPPMARKGMRMSGAPVF